MVVVTKDNILAGDIGQLRDLLKVHFIEAGEESEKVLDSEQRLAIANSIHIDKTISVDWSQPPLEKLITDIEQTFFELPNTFKAELALTMKLLDGYAASSQIETELDDYLEKLRIELLTLSMTRPDFWIKPHPLKLIVDYLYEEMVGWQDGFGRNSDVIKSLFAEAVEKLAGLELTDTDAYVNMSAKLGEDFSKKVNNFQKLSVRLKDSETGLLKAKMSQYTVIDFINHTTKGNKLPLVVSSCLLNQLANEIKLLLVRSGLESPVWIRWKKLLETIVSLYKNGPAAESDTANKTLLHKLPDELSQLVEESMPKSNQFEDFINQIGFDFTQFALGKEVEGLDFCKQLELPGMLEGIDKQVSQSLLNKVKHIKEGQWFLYKDEASGADKRCKLLLSLPDFDQLLLSNFVGQKVLSTNYENFAYLLSSKSVRPISQSSMTQKVISQVLSELLEKFAELQEAAESEAKKKALEARREEEKRIAEEAEKARQEAAAKAQAEAEAIAARKAAEAQAEADAKAAEEQKVLMEKMAVDMKRQARLMIDSLALGTWVEKQDPETKAYGRIKLAVKFNATGRFVFVDADGTTVADMVRDELVEMVLVEKVKLLESDAHFADRLAKVVTTIRSA